MLRAIKVKSSCVKLNISGIRKFNAGSFETMVPWSLQNHSTLCRRLPRSQNIILDVVVSLSSPTQETQSCRIRRLNSRDLGRLLMYRVYRNRYSQMSQETLTLMFNAIVEIQDTLNQKNIGSFSKFLSIINMFTLFVK